MPPAHTPRPTNSLPKRTTRRAHYQTRANDHAVLMDAVVFTDVPAFTELVIRTRTTAYLITVLDPKTGTVVFGEGYQFGQPTRGVLRGCSFGRRMFLPGCIRRGMHMEIIAGGRQVTTPRVREITGWIRSRPPHAA